MCEWVRHQKGQCLVGNWLNFLRWVCDCVGKLWLWEAFCYESNSLLGFLWGVALICLDLIWVAVFLVLDHPTRRTTALLWRRRRRKLLPTKIPPLKKLLFLTPVGLAQVSHQISKLSSSNWFCRLCLITGLPSIMFNFPFFLPFVTLFFNPSCWLIWSGSYEVVFPLLHLVKWFDGQWIWVWLHLIWISFLLRAPSNIVEDLPLVVDITSISHCFWMPSYFFRVQQLHFQQSVLPCSRLTITI